jgi:hypothetical protein
LEEASREDIHQGTSKGTIKSLTKVDNGRLLLIPLALEETQEQVINFDSICDKSMHL